MLPPEAQVIASPMFTTRLRPAPWHPAVTPTVIVEGRAWNRDARRAPIQTAQRRHDQREAAKLRERKQRDELRAAFRAEVAAMEADTAAQRAAEVV